MKYCLAIDIGASSGRHIVGREQGSKLQTKEVYRFPNGVQEKNGHLVWDVDALVGYVKEGMRIAMRLSPELFPCPWTPGVWTMCCFGGMKRCCPFTPIGTAARKR